MQVSDFVEQKRLKNNNLHKLDLEPFCFDTGWQRWKKLTK